MIEIIDENGKTSKTELPQVPFSIMHVDGDFYYIVCKDDQNKYGLLSLSDGKVYFYGYSKEYISEKINTGRWLLRDSKIIFK